MKKLLALVLAALMCMTVFVACSSTETTADASSDASLAPVADAGDVAAEPEVKEDEEKAPEVTEPEVPEVKESDLDYVKTKGTLTVGITDFAPMDFQDEEGNWVGFDADMARAFAEYLGVNVEFQVIDWDNKVMELNSKTIDVVWNGMTLTDEVKAAMSCSNAYCNNKQIVILPTDIAANYPDVESLAGLNFAVEAGSAGEAEATKAGFTTTPVTDQATTLMEVSAGTADAAVIDSLMAGAMVGDGTSYSDLTYTIGLNDEKYGVGFRKGSDLVSEINKFFTESYDDGVMMEIAELYGVEAAIITQY